MDLKEINNQSVTRHPWETARLNALLNILRPRLFEGMNILDVGCGDGFVSRGLFNNLQNGNIIAVDINFSDDLLHTLNKPNLGIRFTREIPENAIFDLILLLDVIEHVSDDYSFLLDIVSNYLSDKGTVLITAPAFQALYSRHDTFLGHYRRYNKRKLIQLATTCGLDVIHSGYLFFSLLLPKLIFYKILNNCKYSGGVGDWRMGPVATNMICKILGIDNNIMISAARLGIYIPGLTGWVLCEKRK